MKQVDWRNSRILCYSDDSAGYKLRRDDSQLHRGGVSVPAGANAARLPSRVDLALVTPCAEPPVGDGWLHEIKHDGHRLVAILNGRGALRLVSRNGFDRTGRFRAPFDAILGRIRHELVIDGEIAVPDDCGVTHIDALHEAIVRGQPERLAFFAFDLVHFDGHDLRRCRIEDRKAWLEDVLGGAAQGGRVVYGDHLIGRGAELFARAREIGAEGIVSKRLGSEYRAGRSPDWLKTKVSEIREFVISGFVEFAGGRLDAIGIAEMSEPGALVPRGLVKFGLAGKGLWGALDMIRDGPATRSGFVPVKSLLIATIRYFGRYKSSGAIRDGVLIGTPRLLDDQGALPKTRQ